MWLLMVVLGFVVAFYYHLREKMRYFEKLGVPHEEAWIIIGNMGSVLMRKKSFSQLLKEYYKKFEGERYFGFYNFMSPTIIIRDPELIREIGIKHFDNFTDHQSFVLEDVDKMFSRNVFQLRGEKWRSTRSILSPTFTGSKMRGMFNLVNQTATSFNDCLTSNTNLDSDVDMKDVFGRYATDVIATAAFGVDVNSLQNRNNDFYIIGRDAVNFDGWKTLLFFLNKTVPFIIRTLQLRLFPQKIENFFRELIESNIKDRKKRNIVRPDMLQLMMQSNDDSKTTKLSIDDMTSLAFGFFFGGFDTTSSTICFAAHEIANNPEIQKKLAEEIRDSYDKILDENTGYDVVRDLCYLDAVVRETLRLHPAGYLVDRLCTETYNLPPAHPGAREITVHPGDVVGFPIQSIHHDPAYFPEPGKFIPERFLHDDGTFAKEMLNSNNYMPFGLGPRICIGIRFALMEVKLVLIHLLASCELLPSDRTQYPVEYSKTSAMLTAENGFWLKLKMHEETECEKEIM